MALSYHRRPSMLTIAAQWQGSAKVSFWHQ